MTADPEPVDRPATVADQDDAVRVYVLAVLERRRREAEESEED